MKTSTLREVTVDWEEQPVNSGGNVPYRHMNEPLIAKITADWPPKGWKDVTVIVAVSGGPDSVGLLRCLAELQQSGAGRLVAAHFNHKLRSADSDEDQAFVEQLCEDHKIRCICGIPPHGYEPRPGTDGIEAAARDLRYEFLVNTARTCGARFVVTAHTLDDQVETILHRILRGTGLAGLAGIPRIRPLTEEVSLVRPLLAVSRVEVMAYLNRREQAYREDASNGDTAITRNRIRHVLLPQLADDYNPSVDAALLRLGTLAAEAQAVLSDHARLLAEACGASRQPSEILLAAEPLQSAPEPVVRQLLKQLWSDNGWPLQAMSYEKWDQLAKFACQVSTDSALNLPGNVDVRVAEGRIRLARTVDA